ncbi:MAG: GTP-binding protein [Candidatus Lokiarchaeota archaeon]|nr:GTP-binding protein [Candidatus Lokiarchaeota archaeon]
MQNRIPIFKVATIGEGGVGKTSIVVRYTEDKFDEDMRMTIGVNFATKKLLVRGEPLKLTIWDLGGQPRFYDVVGDYFNGTKFAIAVYDANRRYTLDRLDDWISRLREASPEADILIVGNKIDVRDDGSGVPIEEGRSFASKYGADCIEVSAKTGENIDELFRTVARNLHTEHMQ